MAYSKVGWTNGQSPALNDTNLNHMDDGIYDNDQLISIILGCIGLATDTWSSSGTYDENDIVVYHNKLYINLTGTNTATTPDNDTTNWSVTTILV